ncbi:YqzL family protein [Priestia koreensis]|nr:YqzL family protein [Priestia koreensis]
MLDLTWKVFTSTGSIDTYLLYKEMERESIPQPEGISEEVKVLDHPIS